MRAFVTGGTGFVGRHLVEALLAQGWEVSALTRNPARAKDLAGQGASLIPGDVTRPRFHADLSHADVLFHTAGWFELGVREARPLFEVNVAGTANVLAMARKERIPRIVFTGTAGVFGPAPPDRPATEASGPGIPVLDPYVETKFQAHQIVLGEMHAGLPVTMVLPAAVFGPRDANDLGRSLAMLAKRRLRVLPSGLGVNTWTHAADVAEAHIRAAMQGRPGEMYLVGDCVLSMYDFYRAAAEAAGVEPPTRRVPMALARAAALFSEMRGWLRGTSPRISRASLALGSLDLAVDATKARKELGWTPRPFEERIRETMAWYVDAYRTRNAPLPFKRDGASA